MQALRSGRPSWPANRSLGPISGLRVTDPQFVSLSSAFKTELGIPEGGEEGSPGLAFRAPTPGSKPLSEGSEAACGPREAEEPLDHRENFAANGATILASSGTLSFPSSVNTLQSVQREGLL
jgi:hypothetical protein